MLDQPRRHSLDRLIQAGIAPRRARRILREFSEHHADIVAERRALGAGSDEAEAEAVARLGTEQQLVANLLSRSELRSWARRRPGVAFALTPVLSFAVAFAASLLVMVALVNWRKAQGDALSGGSALLYWISAYGPAYLLWGLPLAAALVLAVVATHRRESSIWPYIGIVMTCVVGALTNFSVDLPPLAQAPSMTAGIGIGTDHIGATLARAASTAALALLPYIRVRHLQRREVDAVS
ncbi:MAG TPA: hypothetical protein VGN99_07075 [Steroidobacteraceae bacterium]|jgi:hypothetical protein|nr:hypothetical protein [Steroidobacteraceae bacterium]